MGSAEEAKVYLESVVPVMRRLGVREYAGLVLDADPATPSNETDLTERKLSAADIDKRSREERRRVALGASGGPVKRILDASRP